MASTAAPPYAYTSEQASLLLPYYRRFLWDPLLARLPLGVHANTLTLAGSACCLLATSVAFAVPRSKPGLYAIPAVLLLLYLTLDNLDGAQARRTGTSSPLGEFLDHWLDAGNCGLVVLGVCTAADAPPLLTLVALAASSLGFFGAHWSHARTGTLRLDRLADIEGLTAAVGVYLLLASFGAGALTVPLFGPLTGAVALGLLVAGQGLSSAAVAFVRAREGRGDWAPLGVVCAGAVGAGASGASGYGAAAALLVAGNLACSGETVVRRLRGAALPTGRVAGAMSLLVLVPRAPGLGLVAVGAVALVVVAELYRTIVVLRAARPTS